MPLHVRVVHVVLLHVTVVPVHPPALSQRSVCVQALPSLQVCDAPRYVYEQVLSPSQMSVVHTLSSLHE